MFLVVFLCVGSFYACTTLKSPTAEELKRADYGKFEPLERDEVIRYLKREFYFDTNKVEVDTCSTSEQKGWTYTAEDSSKFIYGHWAYCDLRVKNKIKDYGEFKRIKFFTRDGIIISSENAQTVTGIGEQPLFHNNIAN